MTPLSPFRLAAYAGPALPLAALGLPVYIHLPTFYAQTLGLGLAATGWALLASRLLDLAIDPLVGLLCDGGRGKRRRGWIGAGLPLLLLAGWHLFLPPGGVGALYLLVWSAAFYLGFTLMLVPYQAWGAELSGDYAERTRIAAWREGFGLLGVLLALAVPVVFAVARPQIPGMLFFSAATVLVVTVAVASSLVVERPAAPAQRKGVGAALRILAHNRPFRRLILAQGLNATANALPATLFLLFVSDGLGQPEIAGPLLLAYFVAAIAGIPVWLAVAERVGKHPAWRLSLTLTALVFVPVPFLDADLSGFGLAADMALPPAILADVIDQHAADGGGGRAGLYVALWSLTGKLALAVAVGIAFPLLAFADFVPGTRHSPHALAMLGLLYAGAPIVLKLSAVALLHRFPLDREHQRKLQQRIALLSEA